MEKKFFRLVTNAYDNVGGLLYAPKGVYRLAVDGEPVKNWENIIMKLKDGLYTDFSSCVGGANLVSIEFKEVVEKFIPNDYPLEFLPVKAESEKYGNRTYYIMHFKKIFDVIDKRHTVYVDGTDCVIKVCLDYQKSKDLHIFNTQPAINDVIVSGELRRMLRKYKLDLGFVFHELPYYDYGK